MGLTRFAGWYYFEDPAVPDDEAAAIAILRARMGASFATSPTDAELSALVERAVRFVEKVTEQFFTVRIGQLKLRGNGEPRLSLPFPVVSTDQGSTGLTEILIEDDPTAIDPIDYWVNDGAWDGPEDPRKDAFVEFRIGRSFGSFVSRPPGSDTLRIFPYGVGNIAVTSAWGFLDQDGKTPADLLHAIVRLCVLTVGDADDACAVDDQRRGALIAESVQGRAYTYAAHAISSGLTLDRTIDQVLRMYHRPASVVVSRPPARKGRRYYYP